MNSHGHLQPVKNTRQIVISQLITNLIRIFKLKLSLSFLLCVRAGRQGKSDSEKGREREREGGRERLSEWQCDNL